MRLIILLLFFCIQVNAQDSTLFCIFHTEKEAADFSVKVHNYLTENRLGYNAAHWSDVNKSDKEDKWLVKLPYDFQRWPVKLSIDATVKEQIPIKDSQVFMEAWKVSEIEVTELIK